MMMMFNSGQTNPISPPQQQLMLPSESLQVQQLTNMNTINNSNLSNHSGGSGSNSSGGGDEHEELLAEMELIERLPTQERLKQAKRRRAWQWT